MTTPLRSGPVQVTGRGAAFGSSGASEREDGYNPRRTPFYSAEVGAPVASVVPLLAVAGFDSVPSIAAAMVGHSRAITFGSVGSSFLAIQLVTKLPGEQVAPWIAGLFALPIFLTGLSVLHILL